MPTQRRLVRASEIAEWEFCARAWWLGTDGEPSHEGRARRDEGTGFHRDYDRAARRAGRVERLARLLTWAALIAIAVTATLAWWGQ